MNIIQRLQDVPQGKGYREIWLAGGCFWGMQQYIDGIHGIIMTDVGYANGHTPNPTYEQVCAHTTGYAEAVRVVYDPSEISLSFLLDLYYQAIDPTSVNRQGGDVGEQYRTSIYYIDKAVDAPIVELSIASLVKRIGKAIAIETGLLTNYYLAEPYHQKYLEKNPGGYCHISSGTCALADKARQYAKPDDSTLRETLTDTQYSVTQQNATEPPFQNAYHDHFEPGIYVDITTGEPLFLSVDKFESGCGWPAFAQPIEPARITRHTDSSHGMQRTEVRSKTGDAHLGHVFDDGPRDRGGLRYCINSAALRFIPKAKMAVEGYSPWLPLLDEEI